MGKRHLDVLARVLNAEADDVHDARQIVGEHVQSGFVPLSALSRCNELSHAIWFRLSGGPSEFKPADRGADLVSAE
jgi:hypothetical protein